MSQASCNFCSISKQRGALMSSRLIPPKLPARKENLKNCRVQGKYAGTVEDIHKGTVFVRLELGVNAIAHSCYDSRTVGKKDKVSFVVTHIDEERNVAVGIITRIIKQNI